ncbi:lipopolysaccharide core heptose(II) kinase RfaY [Marinobacter sp.]|uniref:lipopolysaccharide core heptose(II) kinase RfaY n=1 Tax=Marinobacter sp. TaxID=50741 RepID=UPI001A034BA2|nr:lipopolysaccharide core heptose(II) kinase RfaY [Marinobacter sp.]MBE0487013.1 hypothetical protein [Marinobacter sp.]
MTMLTQFSYRDYRVKTALPVPEATSLVDDYLDRNLELVDALKDNPHNYVARVNTTSMPDLVLKEPRKRNRRRWERMMTRFRDGEALRVFDSHIKLEELEFHCPKAVLAAELREKGVVTDSFFLYQYQQGKPAMDEDAERVAHELQRLHSLGYTRGDPKAQNFLVHEGKVHFIDFKLSKPTVFKKHSTRMEYAHFLHTMPEGIHYLPESEKNAAGFKFAVWLRRSVSDLKRKKREWREYRQQPAYARKKRAVLIVLGAVVAYEMIFSAGSA